MATVIHENGTVKKGVEVDFEKCKEIIGGYAEPVRTVDGGWMLVHEMGKLIGLKPNVKATMMYLGATHVLLSELLGIPPADIIVGTVVLFDSNEEADRVLNPPQDEPGNCGLCGSEDGPCESWATCKPITAEEIGEKNLN